jgi:putative colanic acid biosynthesis acetyltransferase WcaF
MTGSPELYGPGPPAVVGPAAATLESEGMRARVWNALGRHAFRLSFHNWYGFRRCLLRLFGAAVDPTARVRPSVRIDCPWRLAIGWESAIGDGAVLCCSARVAIGRRCTVSQYAYLCTGTDDYTRRAGPRLAAPITLEDDVWVATDVFVGPGVRIGQGAVVGARSTVFRSLPSGTVCAGDDAAPVGPRHFRETTA